MVITNGQAGSFQDSRSMPVLEMLEEVAMCGNDVDGM